MKRIRMIAALVILLLLVTACAVKDGVRTSSHEPAALAESQTEATVQADASTLPEAEATEATTDAVRENETTILQSEIPMETTAEAPATAETDAPTQAETTATKSTEASSTEPAASQPKPTEPAITQPTPTETQPAETRPNEPAPTQPTPTEPTPPPHTHSWGAWQQTKAPTCAEPGEERRTCPGCGAVESRPIAATGIHSWSETAPTCTEDGIKACSVCNASETLPALGHDWVHYDETGHWETLVTCYCGAQFSSDDAWYEHASASTDLDFLNAHAGYEAHPIWVTDHPAQDICSRCGVVK